MEENKSNSDCFNKGIELYEQKQYEEAIFCFEKAMKENGGRVDDRYFTVLYEIGNMYFSNRCGVDINKAIIFFTSCANSGHLESQKMLGDIYRIQSNIAEAIFWSEAAAKQGDAYSQFQIGNYHFEGYYYLKPSLQQAAYWFTQAANQGIAKAYLNLGAIYYYGDDSIKNYDKAFYWLLKAAEQNNNHAQNLLGIFYVQGISVGKNINEAVSWFTKAAEQDNIEAQGNLGILNFEFFENYDQAVFWLSKAAEKFDGWKNSIKISPLCQFSKAVEKRLAKAQYKLSICYNDGLGVAKDNLTALKWLSKAQENGDDEALSLKRIEIIK